MSSVAPGQPLAFIPSIVAPAAKRTVALMPTPDVADAPTSGIAFSLFLLVNATLFLRPSDVLPSLGAIPIYLILILVCLVTAIAPVVAQLRWSALRRQPTILCTLAMLPAIVLSHLAHKNTYYARQFGIDFLKILIYFLLLIALVDSPARLRTFLKALTLFIIGAALLSLLEFHGVLALKGITVLQRSMGVDSSGNEIFLPQLQGAGIFSDPNDFSVILATGVVVLLHAMIETRGAPRRLLLGLPVLLVGYTFAMTNSRGGFLALLTGIAAMLVIRRGWRRSLPLMFLVVPLMLVLFAGRQTDIDINNPNDTAAGRIYIWREALALFKTSPVFGIGCGLLEDNLTHVAHNSFVHSYTELGMVGGTVFLGMFLLPAGVLRRRPGAAAIGAEIVRWRPCLAGVLATTAAGYWSLSRCYEVSTYTVIGLAAVYCKLLAARDPAAVPALSFPLLRRLAFSSVGCILFIYLFVRTFAR